MRLIDADALMNERGMCEDCDNCKHESRLCRYNQDYSRMDICEMLTDAQTIEAIPVDWLKQQFYDSPNSQWAEKCRDVFTGWQKWQRQKKEQEVQECSGI